MSLLRSLRLCLVARTGSCSVRGFGPSTDLPSFKVSRALLPLTPFDSIPPFPQPLCLFVVQPPRAAFPPTPGTLPADVPFTLGAPRCFIPFFLPPLPPGRIPASVAPAVAHISCWALAVFLGLQQGAPHEAAAKNGLFLCELQESSGDLWRESQTGVGEAGEGSREGY